MRLRFDRVGVQIVARGAHGGTGIFPIVVWPRPDRVVRQVVRNVRAAWVWARRGEVLGRP
jgi:hypothetical protein